MLGAEKRRNFSFLFPKIFGTVLFVLISAFSFAQIDTKIDTAHIRIGEPIKYTLTVPLEVGDDVGLPEFKDTINYHIEILNQKRDTIFEDGNTKLRQELTLTGYDAGEFLIRSFPVVINSDTLLSHSFQIQIDDVEIDSANLVGFPIKTIMEEKYTWQDYWDRYWVYFVAGALLFLVLLTLAILFLRSKKKKNYETVIIKTPYEEAKDALLALDKKKYLEKEQYNPYYSELSLILRRYFGKIYHFSSLELLSDDLIGYFRKTTHLLKEDIEALREFLYDSDLAKFAKSVPEESKNAHYRKWVEEMIDKYKPMHLEDDSVIVTKPKEVYKVFK